MQEKHRPSREVFIFFSSFQRRVARTDFLSFSKQCGADPLMFLSGLGSQAVCRVAWLVPFVQALSALRKSS